MQLRKESAKRKPQLEKKCIIFIGCGKNGSCGVVSYQLLLPVAVVSCKLSVASCNLQLSVAVWSLWDIYSCEVTAEIASPFFILLTSRLRLWLILLLFRRDR